MYFQLKSFILLAILLSSCTTEEGIISKEKLVGTWETWNAGTSEDDWRALEKMDQDPKNYYTETYNADGSMIIRNRHEGKPIVVHGTWKIGRGDKVKIKYEMNGNSYDLIHTVVGYRDSILYVEDLAEGHTKLMLRGILKRVN